MIETTAREKLEIQILKKTATTHIIYGILLLMVFPICAIVFYYIWSLYFLIFTLVSLLFGIYYLNDGIKGRRDYLKIKEEIGE